MIGQHTAPFSLSAAISSVERLQNAIRETERQTAWIVSLAVTGIKEASQRQP